MNDDYLERLDAFLDDVDEGTIPLELLAERGLAMPPDAELNDEELHERLWQVIRGAAEFGLYLESTDHLSDRELYRYLRDDALLVPTFLMPDDPYSATHVSPIGGFGDDDIVIYLRYYADEATRAEWRRDFPQDELPAKLAPPYDRDSCLPTRESRLALRMPA
jgi:hypothetical protein